MANEFSVWVDSPIVGQQIQSSGVFKTDTQRINGFKAGDPASAIRVNSALRQANLVVASLMDMCDKIVTLPTGLGLASSVTDVSNAIRAAIDNLNNRILTSAKLYTDSLGDETSENVTSLQSQINVNKQGITTNSENITTANTKITGNTNEINALKTRVGNAETNINNNKTNIDSANTKINANIVSINNHTNDISAVNARVDTTNKNVANNTTSINNVSDRVTNTENSINSINNTLTPIKDCFRTSISTSSWSGSAGNWTYSIPMSTHNHGIRPIVKTFTSDNIEILCPVKMQNGNLTLYSKANIALAIHVYWGN